MKINVDPSTEAGGFGYANAGRYRLRISKVEHKQKDHPYLKWTLDFVDFNVQSADPNFKKVGSIFENTTLKKGENAQFRLRQLCDAVGLVWGDFDTDNIIGREFEAEVGIKEYNSVFSNDVKKFIPMAK